VQCNFKEGGKKVENVNEEMKEGADNGRIETRIFVRLDTRIFHYVGTNIFSLTGRIMFLILYVKKTTS
jgi:hypothetical protein